MYSTNRSFRFLRQTLRINKKELHLKSTHMQSLATSPSLSSTSATSQHLQSILSKRGNNNKWKCTRPVERGKLACEKDSMLTSWQHALRRTYGCWKNLESLERKLESRQCLYRRVQMKRERDVEYMNDRGGKVWLCRNTAQLKLCFAGGECKTVASLNDTFQMCVRNATQHTPRAC